MHPAFGEPLIYLRKQVGLHWSDIFPCETPQAAMRYLPHLFLPVASLFCASIFVGCTGGTDRTRVPPPPINTAKAKFAYIGNQGASLSGYTVDPSTGLLTPLSAFPFALGTNPTVVTHDPQNRFLIVADIAANSLHVFMVNSATGALSEAGSSPYATVKEPVSVAVDPAGTHIYVASQGGNQVGAYSLSSTGALTGIAGGPFSTGSAGVTAEAIGSATILIDGAGKFLYLQDLANVYVFSIDAGTGALTLQQAEAGPAQGDGLALDPAGGYLYAVGAGSNSISTYSIDQGSGLLKPVKSSPLVEQNGAYTISVSPNGQFAYTIENNNDLVSYALSNGAFTPVGKTYSGIYGEQVAVDPSGSFVYVPQACSKCPSGVYNVVHEFSIGSSGALTPLPVSTVAAGVTPWGITVTSQ